MSKGSTLKGRITLLSAGAVVLTSVLISVVSLVLLYDFQLQRAQEKQKEILTVFKGWLDEKGSPLRISDGILYAGDYKISDNHEIPDRVEDVFGSTATVFMKTERVATSVRDENGNRAVGTFLKGVALRTAYEKGMVYHGDANILGTSYLTVYEPVKNEKGEVIAILYVGVIKDQILQTLYYTAGAILIISVFLAVMIGLATRIYLNITLKPLERTIRATKTLAEGRGDLTGRIKAGETGEMGELASSMNSFLNTIHEIVKQVISVSREMFTHATELENAGNKFVTNSNKSTEEAREISESMDYFSENLNHVASSMQELSTTITEVAQRTGEAAKISREADRAEKESASVIQELRTESDNIGNISQAISEIADKTGILALNASIEAAGAGEAGKGFAVVAAEVKELAREASVSTEEIQGLVKRIQEKSQRASEAASRVSEVTNRLAEINGIIASSAEEQSVTVKDVTKRLEEMAKNGKEISESVKDILHAAGTISADAGENLEAASGLRGSSENLGRLVGKFKV